MKGGQGKEPNSAVSTLFGRKNGPRRLVGRPARDKAGGGRPVGKRGNRKPSAKDYGSAMKPGGRPESEFGLDIILLRQQNKSYP